MTGTSQGLSSTHIGSQEPPFGVVPAVVTFYDNGNLAKVRREHVWKTCEVCGSPYQAQAWKADQEHRCAGCRPLTVTCGCGERVKVVRVVVGEEVKSSGEVVQLRKMTPDRCPVCGDHLELGTRDVVSYFSDDSRRRLMRLLAILHEDYRPHFVTLTFPDTYQGYQDPEDWKACLRRFEHRFRRAFPDGVYIWRKELIDRKSGTHVGEVFPHFHLLVFGVEYNQLRDFVSSAWFAAVGTGDPAHLKVGTQVARVLSRRGIFRYASKTLGERMTRELGKTVQAMNDGRSVGRWWGVVGDLGRFQSRSTSIELTDREGVLVLRAFRKLSKVASRAYRALTVFCSGSWLLINVTKLFASHGKNAYRKTGRRYDVPFWTWAKDVGYTLPAQLAGT